MARVVVLGAGISGHTAAAHLRRLLPRDHEVVVVSPNSQWNWIPSNIWVGVGRMRARDVTFPLAPVYQRLGISYVQAKAVALHPDGDAASPQGAVDVIHTSAGRSGEPERLRYDVLINATGPKLNFAATPGLGPDGHSLSVCTHAHAEEAARGFEASVERLRRGERQTFVIGMGHGLCTCEGAAFEYAFNVEHELRMRGVRGLAEVIYLTNEAELGDFGVAGLTFRQLGFVTSSRLWTESLYRERGVHAILGAHVQAVEPGCIRYETLDGAEHEQPFDFAMLLPPFGGAGLKAFDRGGADITASLFAPNGFMRVDADYTAKPPAEWRAEDWPRTYQSPAYANLFAVGIAFAPPHPISQPRQSVRGTPITPSPPRTGMPSGVMGRTVARSVSDMLLRGAAHPTHTASLASMGAACIASAGADLLHGSAAAMTMYPIVPDYTRYPQFGRDLDATYGEIGLGAHWLKHLLHHLFIYKAKALPGWALIPE